jgi:hypothetical protein
MEVALVAAKTIDILVPLEAELAMHSRLLQKAELVEKIVQGDFIRDAREQVELTKAAIANLELAIFTAKIIITPEC